MKKTDPTKPLIEMTDAELKRCFTELGAAGTFSMLQDARHDKGQAIVLVAAILNTPDGKKHIAFVDTEYGDGEGINMIQTFIDDVHELPGMLKPGESLELVKWLVTEMKEFA